LFGIEGKAVQVAVGQVKGLLYPSSAERAAAYELLVEISTRTTSTTMASYEGSLREALDSLHAMFPITREILRRHGAAASRGGLGNLSLAVIAVRFLNDEFRPVLSRWHPVLEAYESGRPNDASPMQWEQRWALNGECRRALNDMRASIRAYMDTLGHIAGASSLAAAMAISPPSVRFEQRSLPAPPTPPRGVEPRERMVRWLRLAEMWRAGPATLAAAKSWKAMSTKAMSAEPSAGGAPTAVFEVGRNEEFWFDYMSDTGDAFDGTAPIAWLMGRREISLPPDRAGELPPPPAVLPRARLVVLGGDEVYPFAGPNVYENQTELPFLMGFEAGDPDRPEDSGGAQAPPSKATLVAIPGNHDWLGGISHFNKMFATGGTRTFAGHWDTPQTRTFWHVKLPQGWWLWGIDTGLHNELPPPQVEYFAAAAEGLRAGDRVILCTPVPLWQLRQKAPDRYLAIRSALDPLVFARQAKIALCLSGDSHFFAHYESADPEIEEDHITAGGGGAFLHPTHSIPERIPMEQGNIEFRLTSRWPQPAESRALAPGASHLHDRQFWLIIGLLGVLHGAFAWLVGVDRGRFRWATRTLDAPRARDQGLLGEYASRLNEAIRWTLSSPWAWLLLIALTGAGLGAVKANSREARLTRAARIYGLLIGAGLSATFVAVAVARRFLDRKARWPAVAVSSVVGGVVTTAALFWALTWVNAQIKAGDNMAFSSAHLTRFKHFLRFRIDLRGDLTCYVVGVDPVGRGWWKAITETRLVPPPDPAGIPRIHYVWGKTFPKFVPKQMRVSLSVSLESAETNELFARMCTELLEDGHSLLYGGLPGAGFTELFGAAARRRHADNPNAPAHLVHYVASQYWEADWSGRTRDDGTVRSVKVERPGAAGRSPEAQANANLTEMRERMTRDADVRIVMAGNPTPGATGERVAPGVLEEAYLAVLGRVPLIVIGGFGGVGGRIADLLACRLDAAELEAWGSHFGVPVVEADGMPGPGFGDMVAAFGSPAVLRNGLSEGENRELLESRDVETVLRLVRTSIRRIAEHRAG
jgi:hypothetical protein